MTGLEQLVKQDCLRSHKQPKKALRSQVAQLDKEVKDLENCKQHYLDELAHNEVVCDQLMSSIL